MINEIIGYRMKLKHFSIFTNATEKAEFIREINTVNSPLCIRI